jgi:hypothetical protein
MDTDDQANGEVPFRIIKRTGGNDTTVLTIKNQNGNVGIGTTSPSYKLNVLTDTNYDGISLRDSTRELLKIAKGNNGAYINMFESSVSKVNISTAGNSWLNGGNVGIGTNNPGYKLEVNGTSQFNSEMRWSLGTVSHAGYSTNRDWYIRSGVTTGKVILQDTGGNVGVGTNNPTAKLHVNGAIYAPGHPVQYVGHNVNNIVVYGNTTSRHLQPLDITITPKFSNSKIMLHWVVNAEAHHDQVFVIYRGSTLIGYNTNSTGYWSGAAPVHYDTDHNSTLNTHTIVWVDTPNTTSAVTYKLFTRSNSVWFRLNRTVGGGSVGQHNHEIAVSYKSAMEIAV